jgi:cell wall-associated NlpC family hydrolase
MKRYIRALCLFVVLALSAVLLAVPAMAGVRPSVSRMSTHRTTYWGGSTITVHGHNFTHVRKVMFGSRKGDGVHVRSSTTLTVRSPYHPYGTVHLRVVTSAGWSSKNSASKVTFTHPSMNSHIQGGLTGHQEQRISARVRKAHHGVATARRSRQWTAAMGATAVRRARSWLGLPYSWAGGNGSGPTTGVCAHNGGDMDCHIVGFDCSGLTLYSWSPYIHLVHYAATQHNQAGRFHPTIGQLVPGDLVYFSDSPHDVIGHTAIYEGNGNVVQAEESGTVVMQTPLRDVISFSGAYRGATRPLSTGRQSPGPTVKSVTSRVAAKGGYVTITGSQLASATSVVVGGKMLYSFSRRTSTTLVVKVPAHRAGKVSVSVSNPWGTATRSLTYVAAPTVSALTPAHGLATGGTAVTLTGANLTGVTQVHVGSAAAAFHVVAANRLTLTVPAHAAGAVAVTVSSPFGTSNAKTYTYLSTPPPAPAARVAAPHSSSSAPTSSAPNSSSAPPPPASSSASSTSAPPPSSSPSTTGASTSASTSGSAVP